jgi:hypothetical protein
MTQQTKKDWRDLCAAVVNENDPKKLELLIQELTQALDDAEKSEVGKHATPPRSSHVFSSIQPQ